MTCGKTKLDPVMELQYKDTAMIETREHQMMPVRKADMRDLLHDLELWRSKANSGSKGWGG